MRAGSGSSSAKRRIVSSSNGTHGALQAYGGGRSARSIFVHKRENPTSGKSAGRDGLMDVSHPKSWSTLCTAVLGYLRAVDPDLKLSRADQTLPGNISVSLAFLVGKALHNS